MRHPIAAAALCGLWLALWGLVTGLAKKAADPAQQDAPRPLLQTIPEPPPWRFPDRSTLQEYPGP